MSKEILHTSDLVDAVAEKLGYMPKTKINVVLDEFLLTLSDKLADGCNVRLRHVGYFSRKVRKPRKYTNPRAKGEVIQGEGTYYVGFRAAPDIQKLLRMMYKTDSDYKANKAGKE